MGSTWATVIVVLCTCWVARAVRLASEVDCRTKIVSRAAVMQQLEHDMWARRCGG